MEFTKTTIPGVFVVAIDRKQDDRGYFARVWCESEFKAHGLSSNISQENVGFSHRKGTVRGIHFQLDPESETKLVRCTRGSVFDVAVDLRPTSPSFCYWVAVELNDSNGRMLYIPEGCGHGYQTLMDNTEITYQTSRPYAPGLSRGFRYDDSAFQIDWPLPVSIISDADKAWPEFRR
jgi:dTDP-4-dehydrorhamnose 3,5-epimerase